MPLRFLCPTCHGSIDPLRVETGRDGFHDYCIGPECDGVFLVTLAASGAGAGLPVPGERSPALSTRLRRTLIQRQRHTRRQDSPR